MAQMNEMERAEAEAEAMAMAQAEAEAAQQAQPSAGEDMLRGIGSGLATGVSAIADAMPIADLPHKVGKLAGVKIPSVQQWLSKFTGGASEYEPTTTPGKYAKTVAEFAPNVAVPGGALRKAASVAVPGLASEYAGQRTEGTSLEPFARVGGALAGGLATSGSVASELGRITRKAAKAGQTPQELKAAADMLYGALGKAGVRYDSNTYTKTVSDINNTLWKERFRPSTHAEAFNEVDELLKGNGLSPDFDDIDRIIQRLGDKIRDYKAAQQFGKAKPLEMIRDKLDEFEITAPYISDVPINPKQLERIRSEARATIVRQKKQRAIERIVEDAPTYQSGLVSGINNGIGSLLRSQYGKQLFNKSERQLLQRVENGQRGINWLSKFGVDVSNLLSVSNVAKGVAVSGAFGVGNPLATTAGGALIAGGTAANVAKPILKQRALERVQRAMSNPQLSRISAQEARRQNEIRLRRYMAAGQSAREAQKQIEEK